MGQDEMNASFGRHSGRGSRREEYYKFKRQDSSDSLKLNELMRKSGEGSPREHQANYRKAGRNPQRHNDFKTIDDGKPAHRKNYMMGTPGKNDNDYGQRSNYHVGGQAYGGGQQSNHNYGAARGAGDRSMDRMASDRLQIEKPQQQSTFNQRHKSTVPQRPGAENQKFQELLQQKYRKQADNPLGLVMGPSNSKKDDDAGGMFPGLGSALAGLSNGPSAQSPMKMGGQGKNDLINKYKYDSSKY